MPNTLKNIKANNIQNLYTEIAKSLTSSLDYSTIIKKIMDQIYLIFHPENWSLLRVDKKSNELYFVVCEGTCANKIKNLRMKIGEGVAGKVAETGKELIIANVENYIHFNEKIDRISGFCTNSLVAFPIIFQDEILGVIELINLHNLSDQNLEILKTIADFSAIAIHNSLNHEEIIFLATHDALTQVYNRAFLDRLNSTFLNDSYKSNIDDAIIILVDIDNFKQINDKFGHKFGDKILIKLADLLIESCRKSDFVFRIGGDEFLVVITNLNSSDIDFFESEINRKLASYLEDKKLGFSYSFGISRGKIKQLEHVIHLADVKMYKAKHKSQSQ